MDHERKGGPLAPRIAVTDRCRLNGSYCRPGAEQGDAGADDALSRDEIVCFVRLVRAHARKWPT